MRRAGVDIKIVSYNLRKNHASAELAGLVSGHEPDILCLQEADTSILPAEIGSLALADATKLNRLGLAIYYRADRFDASETQTFALKKSWHDRVLAPAHERVIATRMTDIVLQKEFVVASFHAAPLTALNSLRRTQINAAHAALRGLGAGLPSVMVGDYNYPMFKNSLTLHLEESGYTMQLSNLPTYIRYKYFKGHFDFVTSVDVMIESVETLPRGTSDHLPILITAHFTD